MDKIRVDGSNGLRFSLRRIKGCFTPGGGGSPFGAAASTSLISSTSVASDSLSRVPKSGINPNKAVFTIDSKSSQILIVNNNACQLLGYSSKELCSMQFSDILTDKNKSYVCALAEGQLNCEDGTIVLLSGKVVEMNTKSSDKVAVSLWIRQIDNDGRCLAVAEPVERRVCQFVIDRNGIIVKADYECLMIFQFESCEHLIGMEISTLIPAIQLPVDNNENSSGGGAGVNVNIPKYIRKQKATGKTADGISFPLCVVISHFQNDNSTTTPTSATQSTTTANDSNASGTTTTTTASTSNQNFYTINVWVFQNLSGLIVIDEFGFIESCNHHFSMLMFGYAQIKILDHHISKLIPNFGQELEYLGISRSRNVTTESSLDNESETETDPVYVQAEQQQLQQQQQQQQEQQNLQPSPPPPPPPSSWLSTMTTTTTTTTQTAPNSRSFQGIHSLSSSLLSPQSNENTCASLNSKSTIIGDATTTTTTQSTINKKEILYHHHSLPDIENSENDKNIPNLKCTGTSTGTGRNNDLRNSIAINDASCDVELNLVASNNDNDLLTPVNDDSIINQSYSSLSAATNNIITPKTNATNSLDFSSSLSSSSSTSALLRNSASSITTSVLSSGGASGKAAPTITQSSSLRTVPTITTAASVAAPISTPITSTPDIRKNSQSMNIIPRAIQCSDGKYKGEAIHSDGNVIDILYTISKQILPCGRKIYCVWICRDPDTEYNDDDENNGACGRNQNLTLTFNSITSTIEHSLGQAIKNTAAATAAAQNSSSRPNSVSLISQCEDEQISGEFSKYYTTLKQIGKGAYGYVKMAYRNSDRLLVVAKFILKDKLCPQFMIMTEDKKEIPMEIYLLTTVKHQNIVQVYDVFENEKFFQLVMEKHGSGMDLFEFIDRRPLIDEKLGCFIFKQIANAVNYLHSLNILHRDIKDENIIIDHNFHIKLIDFGSATFMEDGKLFSTFFGTTEYCSPEVLAGNRYAGPELEMWSLGVTLYVLMFFENPFVDIEETLRADLVIPHKVSSNLETLLFKMLDKDPKTRLTMRQLMSDPWLNQDINSSMFNFAWIVPCEPYEANPDKYYTGQIYSSTTALSTTSPQDSLSLVDEDSIIDGVEVDHDDEDEEKISLQLQQARVCDNNDKSLSVQSVEALTPQVAYQQNINSSADHNIGLNNSFVSSLSDAQQQQYQQQQQQNSDMMSMDPLTKGKSIDIEKSTTTETGTTTATTAQQQTFKKRPMMKPNSSGSDTLTNDEKKTNASYKLVSVEYNSKDDVTDADYSYDDYYYDDDWEDIDDDEDSFS